MQNQPEHRDDYDAHSERHGEGPQSIAQDEHLQCRLRIGEMRHQQPGAGRLLGGPLRSGGFAGLPVRLSDAFERTLGLRRANLFLRLGRRSHPADFNFAGFAGRLAYAARPDDLLFLETALAIELSPGERR